MFDTTTVTPWDNPGFSTMSAPLAGSTMTLPTHAVPVVGQMPYDVYNPSASLNAPPMTTTYVQGRAVPPPIYNTVGPGGLANGNYMNPAGSTVVGGLTMPMNAMAQQSVAYPHYVHVPIFRTKKRVYVKKQAEGACGCLNGSGLFDSPGGRLGILNCGGCLDRDMAVRVDRYGNVIVPPRRRKQKKANQEDTTGIGQGPQMYY